MIRSQVLQKARLESEMAQKQTIEPEKEEQQTQEIPNLKNFGVVLEGLKDKIKSIKISKKKSEFISKVQNILKLFDKNENQYSDKILLFVMQAVENFILKPNSGLLKKDMVIECVRDFFDDNINLIEKMISLVFSQVKQNKFIKRNLKKVSRFFFRLF